MRHVPQTYDEEVPVDDLVPWDGNPRGHAEDVLDESVDVNGFYGAVLRQKSSGRIIGGHGRVNAARRAGAASVPVLTLDVTDEEAERILLVDNRANDLATNDDEMLAALLDDLGDTETSLAGTGYTDEQFRALLADLALPDSFAPIPDDENPRLDEKNPATCPECGHVWTP